MTHLYHYELKQRQLSPSHELTKLENWLKCNWSLKCWGREFHSLAAPKRKELMPLIDVLTWGISAVLPYGPVRLAYWLVIRPVLLAYRLVVRLSVRLDYSHRKGYTYRAVRLADRLAVRAV
ncbi:hypothetical protein DPMN_155300 [Dreissena polymorpha]|uniref:Uncharacterized protein n=1 Tax=Dreissena polymorpha TaxID=45954 RepID=A0A9D4FNL5_DREPO|nr:hypothetical protein DPMN_155300 [Dreissena polymorpha]